VAVFGSVGSETARPESDIDLLVVAAPLPRRRIPRMPELDRVETAVHGHLASAGRAGVTTPESSTSCARG
jgi:predicted nucleotidyltransferase